MKDYCANFLAIYAPELYLKSFYCRSDEFVYKSVRNLKGILALTGDRPIHFIIGKVQIFRQSIYVAMKKKHVKIQKISFV